MMIIRENSRRLPLFCGNTPKSEDGVDDVFRNFGLVSMTFATSSHLELVKLRLPVKIEPWLQSLDEALSS